MKGETETACETVTAKRRISETGGNTEKIKRGKGGKGAPGKGDGGTQERGEGENGKGGENLHV